MRSSNTPELSVLGLAAVAERVAVLTDELQTVVAEGFELVVLTQALGGRPPGSEIASRIEATRRRLRRLELMLAEFDTTL